MDSEISGLLAEARQFFNTEFTQRCNADITASVIASKLVSALEAYNAMPKVDPTIQTWVLELSLMQQAVILSAIRGPDGARKESGAKHLARWYRRCILVTAFERQVFKDMRTSGGGSFTGPVPHGIDPIKEFFEVIDELPFHYTNHFMNAVQILAYKHPYARDFWKDVYLKWCKKLHCKTPESEEEMDIRLGDNEANWKRSE